MKNLKDNIEQRKVIEFILLDFDNDTHVAKWILQNFTSYLKDGYLKYFRNDQLDKWHASIGKNTCYSMANGAILVNLDCDNYAGYGGGEYVLDQFLKAECNILLWQFSKVKEDGSFGRIAVTRDLFNKLGGYDQSFLPMAYQDNDLIARSRALGVKLIHKKDAVYNQAIPNEKYQPTNMTYKKMKQINKAISKRNLKNNQLTANCGKFGLNNIYSMAVDGKFQKFQRA